jgi:hypothetical protein
MPARTRLVAFFVAATGVVTLVLFAIVRFRGDGSGMDLATLDTAMVNITALAKFDALCDGTADNPSRRGASQSSIACVGLVAAGFTESVRAVLLEEDVRWGARLSHVV